MRRSSKGPSGKHQLSQTFTTNLNAYALAAGAAGVGILAMVQPADAEIVFTKDSNVLPTNLGIAVDLNHDGLNDFMFVQSTFQYHNWDESLRVFPKGANGIIESSKGFAAELPKGAPIGSKQTFTKRKSLVLMNSHGFQYGSSTSRKAYSRHIYGPWQNAQDQYLGVSFVIDGATHYGWVRLSVVLGFRRFVTTISGFAYETVAGQQIHAGQLTEEASASQENAPMAQPSLGMLALGTPGLHLWRRDESSPVLQ